MEIEGESPAQRRVLDDIVHGLGDTAIDVVRLAEWVDDFAEHPSLGLVPTPEEIEESRGVGIRLVRPDPAPARTRWEMGLLASAFVERSQEEALPRVVWLGIGPYEEHNLQFGLSWPPPLDADEVGLLRADLPGAAAGCSAEVESLDVLRPHRHAWAVVLRVRESHAFLRTELRRFFERIEPWSRRCRHYIEIRDSRADPAVVRFQAIDTSTIVRGDLECCDPFGISQRMIDAPPRPACPVFG